MPAATAATTIMAATLLSWRGSNALDLDRLAAGDQRHVRALECVGDRAGRGLAGVGHARRDRDVRARPTRERGERQRVRVADLPGCERLAGRHELVPRSEDREARDP